VREGLDLDLTLSPAAPRTVLFLMLSALSEHKHQPEIQHEKKESTYDSHVIMF